MSPGKFGKPGAGRLSLFCWQKGEVVLFLCAKPNRQVSLFVRLPFLLTAGWASESLALRGLAAEVVEGDVLGLNTEV